MVSFKLLFFVAALAAVSAMPQYHHGGYHQALHAGPVVHAAPVHVAEHVAPAHYKFSYGVSDPHTHDIKEQEETREGHKVQGHYSLVEPDGTRRVVHYTADEHNGFNAVVHREGHASHPAQVAHKVVAAPVVAPVVAHHSAPAISHLGYAHSGHGYH